MPSKNDARSWTHTLHLGLAGLLLIGAAALPSTATAAAPGKAADDQGTIVKVEKGKTKVLTIPGMSRVAVGDAEIADIRSLGNGQLEITGRGEGKTTLLVWVKSVRNVYTIEVTGSSQTGAATPPAPPPAPATATAPDGGAIDTQGELVKVEKGKTKLLTVRDMSRVAVGDAEIADIRAKGDQLEIVGQSEGKTTLLVWVKDGSRKVYTIEVAK